MTLPSRASKAKNVSELPATYTNVFTPCGVTTLAATTGGIKAFRAKGTLSTCVCHFSSSPLTFSADSVSSSLAQPDRCGSCPKVGQSDASSSVEVENEISKKRTRHTTPLGTMRFLSSECHYL